MIGLIALGKTPRPDFEEAAAKYLPDKKTLIMGALDTLSEKEVAKLASQRGDYLLRVPACGKLFEIAMDLLVPLIIDTDKELRRSGASMTILMCCGMFPSLPVSGPILYPGRIITDLVSHLFSGRPIGIILPNEAQIAPTKAEWEKKNFTIKLSWADPMRSERLAYAAKMLGDDVDAVVLDCMGMGEIHRDVVRSVIRKPILLPLEASLLTARMVAG